MILLRVLGTVLEFSDETEASFDAGIDSLAYFKVGETFAFEVEVTERDGDRMTVRPVGPRVDRD